MSRHFPVHLVAQVILVRDLKLGLSGWEKVAILDEGEVNSPLHVLLPAVQVTRQTSGQRHDDSFEVLFGNSRVVSSSDHIFQGVRVLSLVHVVGATVLGLLFGNPNTPRFGGFECEIEETEFLVYLLIPFLHDRERIGGVAAGHGAGVFPSLSLAKVSVQSCQMRRFRGLCHKFCKRFRWAGYGCLLW
jgi:hypothetical protein